MAVKRIPIARIVSGAPSDRNKLARYRRALRLSDVFPPISVIHFPGWYEVQDGFHRFRAHCLEGRKTIRAKIIVNAA